MAANSEQAPLLQMVEEIRLENERRVEVPQETKVQLSERAFTLFQIYSAGESAS